MVGEVILDWQPGSMTNRTTMTMKTATMLMSLLMTTPTTKVTALPPPTM